MRFEHLANAGNRAACTNGGNEIIHLPIHIAQNFLRCRAPVRFSVSRVSKLAGNIGIGMFLPELLCPVDRALHPLRCWRQHKLRAQRF